MTAYETLDVRTEGAIREIILNRPKQRNAINTTLESELAHALQAAEAEEAIRAVTIRGAGKAFSAGHDLKEFAETYLATDDPIIKTDLPQLAHNWFFSKPLLAGVHGYVGPEANKLVAACDFAIAAKGTRFSFEQARMGSVEPMDPVMCFALPMGVVKKLWLMGGWFDAESALQWRYVQRVVPHERLEYELRRWAKQAALVPPARYADAKRQMRQLYVLRGLVAGSEARQYRRDPKREAFYRTLLDKGLHAALQFRDSDFDPEVSKV